MTVTSVEARNSCRSKAWIPGAEFAKRRAFGAGVVEALTTPFAVTMEGYRQEPRVAQARGEDNRPRLPDRSERLPASLPKTVLLAASPLRSGRPT